MKNLKAIVTFAIGDKYYLNWKKFCEPNWKRYSDRHGFDLICLDRALDTTERAHARSVSWQKCLILGQDFAGRYDQIVWVDADIIFNACAPDITSGVPLDKVGAVESPEFSHLAYLKRAYKLWPEGAAVINYTAREYYSKYGLPADCDRSFNAGVMVLSPRFHRSILEHVYYSYEAKDDDRKWHIEQRPLSYEVVKSGTVHWLDPRFNVLLWFEAYSRYPFLQRPPASPASGFLQRIERKIRKLQTDVQYSLLRKLNADAVNAVFQASFFLHFASKIEDMPLVREHPSSWWDILT